MENGQDKGRPAHTFASAEHGVLPVPVAVVRTYHRRRSGQRTAAWLLYACLQVDDPPQQVRKRYRHRFGIESSYRLMEQGRARATSPRAGLRFLLIGLAVVLVNVWICLHWLYLRVPGRGLAAGWLPAIAWT